jgi:hypothetical protein
VVDDDGLDDTVSGLIVGRQCLIGKGDAAQPSNRLTASHQNRGRALVVCLPPLPFR